MYQNNVREESPVEVTAPPPKPSRRRQKRMVVVQNEDAPCCTPWTNEEEIALCKGWVHGYENSAKGNARETYGFWTEVLAYLCNKTKQPGRRTYDVVNGKWKTVRPSVARFCGVHANVLRRAHDSGAGDEDYFNKALLDYEAEFGVQFTLCYCWEVLKHSPKWWEQEVSKFLNPNAAKRSKTSGSSPFNTVSDDASFNLNIDAGDEDENEVQEVPRPIRRDKVKGSDHRDH
ncbi:hypothetical protein Tco_0885358 [Tanacetum coccineum]